MRVAFDMPMHWRHAAPVVREDHPAWRRAPYRAVFMSDLHLGTPACQAQDLLEFLKAHPSDFLYLCGDIVDGGQLHRRWYWPQSHNDVLQKIMRKARKGCRVVFIPGRQDAFARQFAGHHFGGIEVALDAVHVTAAGERLWVIHGDAFDRDLERARWLAVAGDRLQAVSRRLTRQLQHMYASVRSPGGSPAASPGRETMTARKDAADFGRAVSAEARRRGHDGVVCGHTHRAEMRPIDGTLYCNAGDWVGNRSALIEHPDGHLELRHCRGGDTSASTAAQATDHA